MAAIIVLLVFTAAACGGGKPKEHSFELEIRDGSLVQGEQVLQVKQDDMVTMVVTADEPVSFHLHGYDIEKGAKPGEPATLKFTADATGSFPFTMHVGAEDHIEGEEHGQESHVEGKEHGGEANGCELQVPSGAPTPELRLTASPGKEPGEIDVAVEVENFVLSFVSVGSELAAGHWDLYIDGELEAMYEVTGATVVVPYSGEHQVMARLVNVEHCSFGIDAVTMVVVEEGYAGDKEEGAVEEDHEEDEHEEEIDLGRLEVFPR
jgi:hypothetical protein